MIKAEIISKTAGDNTDFLLDLMGLWLPHDY